MIYLRIRSSRLLNVCLPQNERRRRAEVRVEVQDLVELMIYLILIAFALAAECLRRYLKDGDEVPLVTSALCILIVYRGWLLDSGRVDPVAFQYGIDFVYDHQSILTATLLILVGFVSFTISYYSATSRHFGPALNKREIDNSHDFRRFLARHVPVLWSAAAIFIILYKAQTLLGPQQMGTGGTGGSSYLFLFGMGISSFIIGLAVYGDILHPRDTGRWFYFGAAGLLSILTFNPSLRFQMLGWALFLVIYFSRRLPPLKRLVNYGMAGAIIAIGFSVLGGMRHEISNARSISENIAAGNEAFFEANDVNFVDGMVMVGQVYPKHLDYSLGIEHLEILLRPIPRAWWPNKPKGGWAQKWATKNGMDNFGTGISPSIFGTFYAEGGLIGIAFFSLLYGWGLGRLMVWSRRFRSAIRTILKGVIIASSFAMIRGGDLPGTVAFLGMSFWPIGLFLYYYLNSIREQKKVRRKKKRFVGKRPKPSHESRANDEGRNTV